MGEAHPERDWPWKLRAQTEPRLRGPCSRASLPKPSETPWLEAPKRLRVQSCLRSGRCWCRAQWGAVGPTGLKLALPPNSRPTVCPRGGGNAGSSLEGAGGGQPPPWEREGGREGLCWKAGRLGHPSLQEQPGECTHTPGFCQLKVELKA